MHDLDSLPAAEMFAEDANSKSTKVVPNVVITDAEMGDVHMRRSILSIDDTSTDHTQNHQPDFTGVSTEDTSPLSGSAAASESVGTISLPRCEALTTGLFVGSGAALAKAGPLGVFLAFLLGGVNAWAMMISLGEMATALPVAGTFVQYATRFVDPSLGFALGWNAWYGLSAAVATELTASAIIISYWSHLSPAIWITICFLPMLAINFVGVRWYGEAEVVTASIKVLTFVGYVFGGFLSENGREPEFTCSVFFMGLVITLGGAPNHDRIGFRYWRDPGPLNAFPGVTGSLGEFLALFRAFVNAAFAYSGTESVIYTAAEASNPTSQIPRAARRVLYRIVFFYIAGTLIIGMTVPYTDEGLVTGAGNAASSPLVIAAQRAGIKAVPYWLFRAKHRKFSVVSIAWVSCTSQSLQPLRWGA